MEEEERKKKKKKPKKKTKVDNFVWFSTKYN